MIDPIFRGFLFVLLLWRTLGERWFLRQIESVRVVKDDLSAGFFHRIVQFPEERFPNRIRDHDKRSVRAV